MKQLVRQDARQLSRTPRQFLVQNDFALSNKCRCVNWLAEFPVGIKFARPGCQGWQEADLDVRPLKRREPLLNRLNEPVGAVRVVA